MQWKLTSLSHTVRGRNELGFQPRQSHSKVHGFFTSSPFLQDFSRDFSSLSCLPALSHGPPTIAQKAWMISLLHPLPRSLRSPCVPLPKPTPCCRGKIHLSSPPQSHLSDSEHNKSNKIMRPLWSNDGVSHFCLYLRRLPQQVHR